ncbi:hypothetical protein BKA70DRAFT_1285687 [Coprinopsis sp. MPI-PUGE-AT-0042]|nr:hypothetical protein BKA70DRAFT_1285687 [Coprinopsis sp. MPI-PUGE-AT-0042]
MADTHFEEGVYTIANLKTPSMVIEAKDGKAILGEFIASETQQWELAKMYNAAYSIRNIATRRYLGMDLGDFVRDRYELHEVDHVFPWNLRLGTRLSILVPYIPYVVAISSGAQLESPILLREDGKQVHQRWHLCKDLHLATSNALRNGSTYRIVNSASQTAIEVNDSDTGCFAVDNGSEKQKFLAIKTDAGWAFQNIEAKRYLGLPNSAVAFKDGTRLSSVSHQSTWIVVPHHEDTSKFKLWIPFSSRVMDLHGGETVNNTPIHMDPSYDAAWQWWRFEPVNSGRESNGAVGAESESEPGEPEA